MMTDKLFHPLEGPQMIKANLNVGYLRLHLRRFLYILIVSASIFVLLYVAPIPSSDVHNIYIFLSLGYQACFTIIAPFLLFYYFYMLINVPSLREREQQRQAAACGDQRFLAVEQPFPDAHASSLPFTLRSHPDWSVSLTSLIVMLPCMSVLVLAWSHFRPDPFFDFLLMVIASISFFLFFIVILIKLYLNKSTRLVVTEDGLTLHRLGSHAHHLAWKDMRFFAINAHVYTLKKNQPTIFFEVSGVQEIICWSWKIPDKSRDDHLAGLAPLFEEYDEQIQALFSLIVARTGLLLYDLRKR